MTETSQISWRERQQNELDRFLEQGAKGVFSYEGHPSAVILRKCIERYCMGKIVLDVGCGLLPRPSYMPRGVFFVGIDPYDLQVDREFTFICGKAENMPFENEEFYGVVFATTLDHVEDVDKTMDEALRVLQVGGFMFIWTNIYSKEAVLDLEDAFHARHFTLNDVIGLTDLELVDFEKLSPTEVILIFQK